ncbi:MAG TPA: flippase-like domain-containing protein, partial [Thermodesulfobacteriota bacterium]|nr:flippase-like domain-containing protein [Thermodesulfobacteriota bacterium]
MNRFINPDREQPSDVPAIKTVRAVFQSRIACIGLLVGVALFAAIIAWQGISDIAQALGRAGWGIIAIALLHLPPLWADAIGWRSLFPRGHRLPRRTMLRARWIGESINDLLPVLQMGGNVVKAWFLVDRGIQIGQAGASVIVDITLVVMTQILFTLLGIILVAPTLESRGSLLIVFTGTVIMAVLLGGFYEAQRRGFIGAVMQISRRILGGSEWFSLSNGATMIDAEVMRLYGKRRALATSGFWHIISWFLGVAEVWLALHLLGHPVDLGTALLFESLGQAIRTGAFAVPGALGIQEGGYVLVGGILGIEPSISLALSLSRRVRELLLGLPGLVFWQASTIRLGLLKGPNDPTVPPSKARGMV